MQKGDDNTNDNSFFIRYIPNADYIHYFSICNIFYHSFSTIISSIIRNNSIDKFNTKGDQNKNNYQ